MALGILVGLEPSQVTAAESGWGTGEGYRIRPLAPAGGGTAGFTVMPSGDTGFLFTNQLAQGRFLTNQIHLNGSGVALGDVDGDGRCDVFLAGLDGANALFRNLGGWRFTNIAEQAGVALPGLDATGVVLADLDGDRDLDLVLNTVAQGTHVLLNDGRGRFGSGPGSPYNPGRGGMSLAVADTDGDGDLDVYVGNYRTDTFRDQPGTRFRGKNVGGKMVLQTVNGRPVTDPDLMGRYTIQASGVIEEHGEGDVFLRNDGAGRFSAMGVAEGLLLDEAGKPLTEPPYDWTLAVAFRDLNGDGSPDLYVCNDFSSPDELWFNDGHGKFRRSPRTVLRHLPMFSMGVDFADLNHDGFDDFVVVDMLGLTHGKRHTQLADSRAQFIAPSAIEARPQYSYNQLFLNRGDSSFTEIGWYSGVMASDWTWSPLFLDVDLDGLEDLLLGTGHELEMMDADIGARAEQTRKNQSASAAEVQRLKLLFPRHNVPNVAFRNLGGLTFTNATALWRFGLPVISTGMAMADLDGDGDEDVVLNNLNDAATLLRNDATAPRLSVRLRGQASNADGIGARIAVRGGPVPQSQEIMSGGRYLSSDAPERTFASGTATELGIEVRWRSGRISRVSEAKPGNLYEITEPDATTGPMTAPSRPAGVALFEDVSARLGHVHVDEAFDDFAVQPLLPHRLSQQGPGLVWADLDGDGDDDLAIGGGRGGVVSVFRNQGGGRFEPFSAKAGGVLERDVLGMVAWPGAASGGDGWGLLVALANWEDGSTTAPSLAWMNPAQGNLTPVLAAAEVSPGAVVLGDWDGDGDLDAFVGGRVVPARYPAPAPSRWLRNEGGQLREIPGGEGWPQDLGLVTGAASADLTGDGNPELVVANDWGPIRILRNEKGRFMEWDPEVRVAPEMLRSAGSGAAGRLRLSNLTGCWGGLAAGDFDGDGRLDVVAGNWGFNSRWELAADHPLRLYYGDYDGNGALETLEAVFVRELGDYGPLRTWKSVSAALPFVREAASTHAAFGKSTIPALLKGQIAETRFVEAWTRASVVLLNRGDAFEARALPAEAQWSPVFGITVADFDGDGAADLFLAQNLSGVHGETARQDAGRGLIMRGNGGGEWEPMSASASGLRILGDGRGAAVADWDGDGRTDLAVGQNSASTRLFRNVGARPGLRVRLAGPAGNPAGVGASVRLGFGGRLGPAWLVNGGGGWMSQSSGVLVVGSTTPPDRVEVRWPGGKRSRVEVRSGASEVVVPWPGEGP